MLFTKTLTALLVSVASLATFTNASLAQAAPVTVEVAKRGPASHPLSARVPGGFQEVDMSNNNIGAQISAGPGLWTSSLVTCIGVVVTGTAPQPTRNTRFLAHLSGNWWQMESQRTAFLAEIGQADLQDKQAWISYPDTD
jgi:hypothetical protein